MTAIQRKGTLLCCSLCINLLHAVEVKVQSWHTTEMPTIAEVREETQLGSVCASSHVISIVGQIDGLRAIGRQQDVLLAQAQPGNGYSSTAQQNRCMKASTVLYTRTGCHKLWGQPWCRFWKRVVSIAQQPLSPVKLCQRFGASMYDTCCNLWPSAPECCASYWRRTGMGQVSSTAQHASFPCHQTY